jgi:hypothetical protein
MDAVQQILNRLDTLDMSVNQFGKLAKVSSGEITSRLNGRKPLNGELAIRLLRLTDALVELKKSINAPLGWGKTEEVLALLKQREEAKDLEERCQHLLAE